MTYLLLMSMILSVLVMLWMNSIHYGELNVAKRKYNRQLFRNGNATIEGSSHNV